MRTTEYGYRSVRVCRTLRAAARLALAYLLLIGLAACGGSGITQTTQTARYKVQLTLDGVGFGAREATIDISDASGSPVTADQVVFAPVMRQMGMAAIETTAQPIGPGRYRASGEFFSMVGEWEVDVRISAGGAEDLATFKVQTTE